MTFQYFCSNPQDIVSFSGDKEGKTEDYLIFRNYESFMMNYDGEEGSLVNSTNYISLTRTTECPKK